MTQGLYVRRWHTVDDGTPESRRLGGWERPASKKAVKLAAAEDPSFVRVEATSYFGNEPEGTLTVLMDTAPHSITFVGPDPQKKRTFYGTLTITRDGKVTVS